jgi:hypothetical protein
MGEAPNLTWADEDGGAGDVASIGLPVGTEAKYLLNRAMHRSKLNGGSDESRNAT